jgi:iron complex outermembrane receptor protein
MPKYVTCRATFVALCALVTVGAYAVAETPKQVDIPAGELSLALLKLSKQYGADLVYRPEQVHGLKTRGAHGQLTTEQAVTQLLQGTPLELRTDSSGAMLIAPHSTAAGSGDATTQNASSGSSDDASTKKEGEKNTPGDFRLAQVERGATGPSAVDMEGDKSSEKKKSKEEGLSEIVVTGTHIRGAPLSSPLIEITQVDIERSGYANVGDVIRSLPQNFSGGNNPQNIGATPFLTDGSDNGGTSPNLRGIGSGSTLTLVNGHRLANDTTDSGVDASFIPVAAIERIDVVTDGASAAYGADAVGGVVNFILKKDYDGAQTSALVGNSTDGGAHETQFSQLIGKSWQSGGALLAYTYDKQAPVWSSKRDFAALAAQPLALLPGSELKSYFLSAHQEIPSYASAFIEALYGTRSTYSVATFPASGNLTQSGVASVEQYDVNAGITLHLPGNWQLTSVVSSAVNLAAEPFTSQPLINEDGRTRSIEANAEGSLFALPAGDVRLALGAGYRHEAFNFFTPGFLAGGARSVKYGYGELEVPIISAKQELLLRRLDLNLSGRDDDYSDTGGKSVPKIGIVLSPTNELSFRTTWGKAFRAPPLADKYGPVSLLELSGFPDPASPSGTSQVLVPSGTNPLLKPESATTKTIGFDYAPARVPAFKVSGTYYTLAYTNRIEGIPNLYGALESSTFASFVTRNPSAALQESLIAAASASGGVYNETGGPFDPTQTAAVVNATYINVARQDLRGFDLLLSYKMSLSGQTLDLFANATHLDFREALSPSSPQLTLSGTAFYPPKLRMRGGATWSYGSISTTGVLNYLGSEVNTFATGQPHVSSWTTMDLNLTYSPPWTGWLSGSRASLSVRNLFDKDPPYVQYLSSNFPGANYDSTNASPLGRFLSLQVAKKW